MRVFLAGLALFTSLSAPSAWASGDGAEDKKAEPQVIELSKGVRNLQLPPVKGVSEPLKGVVLNITQFSYPGVPERAACRIIIRMENQSARKVMFYSLIRTFDTQQTPLGTWMTPSGELAPGQAGERLYSCKLARFLILDRSGAAAWPNVCTIDGEERSPCPIQLTFDTNIDLLPEGKGAAPAPASTKH